MKSFITLPTAQDFFDRYAHLIHTLNRTTPLTQIISAATEIGVIYSAIFTAVNQVLPDIATGAAITCAVLGTALLEMGLRVLFPYGWRAILYRRFKGLDLLMTVAIWAALIMFVGASGVLSFTGGKQAVIDNIPPPELATTAEAEELAEKDRTTALATFTADSAAITTRYAAQIDATGASYTAQIDAAKGKVQYYRQREAITGNSYASARAKEAQRANELESEKAQAIAQLRTAEAEEIRAASQARTTALASITGHLEEARAEVTTGNKTTEEEHLAKTNGIGLGVGWFTLICLAYFALVTLLYEAMKKGSGIEDRPQVDHYHFAPGIMAEATGALSERWNYWTRNTIQRFADATPPAPLPANMKSLYDLSGIRADVVQLEAITTDQGGNVLRIPRKADARLLGTDSTNTVVIRSDELEEKALELIGAGITLEAQNYHGAAEPFFLQAKDVLKMYLGPDHKAEDFTELYNGCIGFLNGNGNNPFEHHHRRKPIGFGKASAGDTSTGTGQQNATTNDHRYNGDRYTVESKKETNTTDGRQRQCKHCGQPFTYKHWNKQYCSDKCKLDYHAAQHGGQRFDPAEYRKGKKRRS